MITIRKTVSGFAVPLTIIGASCSAARESPTATQVQPQITEPPAPPALPSTPSMSPDMQAAKTTPTCDLPVFAAPTLAPTPEGLYGLDPTTGLHLTGRPVVLDPVGYRLSVTGNVDHPLSLSLDDLRCMPKTHANVTLVCPNTFTDVAAWAGTSLQYTLGLAHVRANATRIVLSGADGYIAGVPLNEAQSVGGFLAYEWEGQPIPIMHGFPVRAIFPGMTGARWVKWLVKIEVQ